MNRQVLLLGYNNTRYNDTWPYDRVRLFTALARQYWSSTRNWYYYISKVTFNVNLVSRFRVIVIQLIKWFELLWVWKLPERARRQFTGTAKIHFTVSTLFTLKTSFITLYARNMLFKLSASVNSGSVALSCHFHRLTAFCCLHDCRNSRDPCATCAVVVRTADDNVCIAKYSNCTHVCNFLVKVKLKFTM